MKLTHGHLLGGRIRYAQPQTGYRTGIEPVLLAAFVPARPGERVLEAGTGAGAGLLCLSARVPTLAGVGLEISPAMANLARQNLAANGVDGFEIRTGDVAGGVPGPFDHAFANPPWHDRRSTPSPRAGRRAAKQQTGTALETWVASLAGSLRPGGTLTLILPAGQTGRAGAAMQASGLGALAVTNLLPKLGRPAKLALIAGRLGAEGAGRTADVVLHREDGAYTDWAEAILRGTDPAEAPSPAAALTQARDCA